MPAPKPIVELVERYGRGQEEYEAGAYNETQLRREFIDPFLEALGWDVDNTAGYAEAYKDVVHEDSIRIDGSPKAPDYSLRVGGTRKLFVEAKKPALKIGTDRASAYQLRRYAWSAGLPLSILTNFASFAVYDCRVPPKAQDRATKARVLLVTFDEYQDRWDEIAEVFSREAVLKGEFDRFIGSARGARGTAPIDAYFLREMEAWREDLASDIARRNPTLDQQQLNYAVQTTLDRIVFLRICEDRGLEDYGSLKEILPGAGIYARLLHLFELADSRYNSGLFHFKKEPGRGVPDELTPSLSIDDKLLRGIVTRLYYPDSPYEFSVVSAEILGQAYEQFLGKVIHLRAGRKTVVEEKIEVRRAGGVYYTPAYIVHFIVDRVLGPALKGLSPTDFVKGGRRRKQLRIVDPACGSGSFLITAYQYLLDWYLARYVDDEPVTWAKGRTPRVFQGANGDWRLTTAERKRILLDHIFGVDIDSQAVEVTKLSLLLKVLEGEAKETLQLALRIAQERALPDLDRNIRCGNSLVGSDVYDELGEVDEDTAAKINPFDWDEEFPAAAADGGFDAVIGNPPYVYRNATEDQLRPYYTSRYDTAQGNFDLYKFFSERGLQLARPGGRLGFIVSASFLVQPSFSRLREFLLANGTVEQLAPLGPGAFEQATIDSCILVAGKRKAAKDHEIDVRAPRKPTALLTAKPYAIPQSRFRSNPEQVFDYRLTELGAGIVQRLGATFPPLDEGFEFGVGINTGYIRSVMTSDERLDDTYHPMVPGSGISRFGGVHTDGYIMYDPEFIREQGSQGRSLPKERFFTEPKILVVRTRNLTLPRRIVATLDDSGAYNLNRLSNIVAKPGKSLAGLLGVLNSKLFQWLFSTRYFDYEIKPVYLRACPLADTEDRQIVNASEGMLDLQRRIEGSRTADQRTPLERQAAKTERQLDEAVFRAYGIGAAERDHVEDQVAYFADVSPSDEAGLGFALTLAAQERRREVDLVSGRD